MTPLLPGPTGTGRVLRFLFFRPSGFRAAPERCAPAAPWAELSPTPSSVGGWPREAAATAWAQGEGHAPRAGTPSSATAPPVALPRARGVLPGLDGAGGGSGCRSLTPAGSLCPSAVPPRSRPLQLHQSCHTGLGAAPRPSAPRSSSATGTHHGLPRSHVQATISFVKPQIRQPHGGSR